MYKQFSLLNEGYPNLSGIQQIEQCIVDNNDIPQGYGGINKEKYTFGELRRKPIINEILRKISLQKVRTLAEECNIRNTEQGFIMFKIDGEYCFWGLRLAPIVKVSNVNELRLLLEAETKTAEALRNKQITAGMIRKITYSLLKEELASMCEISYNEAEHVIGNELDCAPHEDPCGYIFMVPNWAHKWFKHDGYVCKMLRILNQ